MTGNIWKAMTFWIVAIALVLTNSMVRAERNFDGDDRQFIQKFYSSGTFDIEQFSSLFLSKISPERLEQVSKNLQKVAGKFESVSGADGKYVMLTDTHRMRVNLTRAADGKIAGLRFLQPERRSPNLDEIKTEVAAFPGTTSLYIEKDGEVLIDHKANENLAVGSTFKIGIMKALEEAIDDGSLSWERVVRLKAKHKSLPSGKLQNMPVGSPFTLHTLAALMMSESDNTATDMLLDVVGWEPVAKILGLDVVLTTREFFALKANPLEAEVWRNSKSGNRLEQKIRLSRYPLPAAPAVMRSYEMAIGWALSTRKLCEIMMTLERSSLLALNAGLASKEDWAYVAYKGGNDIGAYNYTTRVEWRGKKGCVSLTWNGDADTDISKLVQLYREALSGLKNSP